MTSPEKTSGPVSIAVRVLALPMKCIDEKPELVAIVPGRQVAYHYPRNLGPPVRIDSGV
jgi:hypothetical protein